MWIVGNGGGGADERLKGRTYGGRGEMGKWRRRGR